MRLPCSRVFSGPPGEQGAPFCGAPLVCGDFGSIHIRQIQKGQAESGSRLPAYTKPLQKQNGIIQVKAPGIAPLAIASADIRFHGFR